MKRNNITEDKIELIYEFNNNSPLFARVAQILLRTGEIEKSLSVMEVGISKYPAYASAYFIYGQILAKLERFDDARRMIIKGGEILGAGDTVEYYLDLIEIKEDKDNTSQTEESRRVQFDSEDIEEGKPNNDSSELSDQADDLEFLANALQNAKIPVIRQEEEIDDYKEEYQPEEHISDANNPLVSETLAGIYFEQGNLLEALELYETLLEQHPDKYGFYMKKINEINHLLES